MANENNNEAKVIDMTATENENMAVISAKKLNDLQESNANLIAERETLMGEVEQLKKKLEEESASKSRMWNRMWKYWQNEEKKVQFLLAFIESGIKGTEYMNASEFVKRLVEGM